MGAILDTSTNILLVPKTLLKPLQAAMCSDTSLASCSDFWADKCLPLTDAQLAAYPPMSLNLDNGVKLAMTAKDYLLTGSPLAGGAGNYCLGIKDGGDAGGGFIICETTIWCLTSRKERSDGAPSTPPLAVRFKQLQEHLPLLHVVLAVTRSVASC